MRSAKRVAVAGDYDMDGICGSLIVSRTLGHLGIPNDIYLPDRSDGYGFSSKALEMAREKGANLIVAVDCGTNDIEVSEQIEAAGIKLVVLDHHLQSGQDQYRGIIVNPVTTGTGNLCGAGVAFKLAQALDVQDDFLVILAGPAMMADSVPLLGENRLIAREGLRFLRRTSHPGLAALIHASKLAQDLITSRDVAFYLAPRLNAAGRITIPYDALRLLQADDPDEGARIAARLNSINERRKAALNDALVLCAKTISADDVALVVYGDIPLGVCGIAAAKLAEQYGKPAFVGSVQPDGTVKGSARSVEGYSVAAALADCAEHLTGHGGHAARAGFSAKEPDMPALRAALNQHAREHCPAGQAGEVRSDVRVRAEGIALD